MSMEPSAQDAHPKQRRKAPSALGVFLGRADVEIGNVDLS